MMIRDLRKIASGKMVATKVHLDFYAHELREFVRFRVKGFASGSTYQKYPVYRPAHYATLLEYGIPIASHEKFLYTQFAWNKLLTRLPKKELKKFHAENRAYF